MAYLLKDKVAIVTGSSSGIGEAIAVVFASRGAKVTLCGRDKERLQTVFDKVVKVSGGHQDSFLTVQGDLNDQKVRKETIDKTIEKFGRLDILVANAGISLPLASIATATEESYNAIMNTNLKSVFFLIQEAVPHLEKTKGAIVNISSAGTSAVVPMSAVTLMSKVALDHLTRCLAVDLGSKGIRVNSVNPGHVPTRIGRSVGGNIDDIIKAVMKFELDQQPLKNRSGTVQDIAEAVTFLASDASGFITGEHIKVDGGRCFGAPLNESVFQPKP